MEQTQRVLERLDQLSPAGQASPESILAAPEDGVPGYPALTAVGSHYQLRHMGHVSRTCLYLYLQRPVCL